MTLERDTTQTPELQNRNTGYNRKWQFANQTRCSTLPNKTSNLPRAADNDKRRHQHLERHRCAGKPVRHCATSTSVGTSPEHVTDLEHVQCVNLRQAEFVLCAPTMQQRTSRVKFATHGIPALWWRSNAPNTYRATRRTTHCMLRSCRLQTEYPLPVSQDSLTFPHPRNVRRPNCCVFTGCAKPPCRPMRLPLATCISQASWVRVGLRVPIKCGVTRLARPRCIYHNILTSLHCLPLVRGGKREHVRFSTGLWLSSHQRREHHRHRPLRTICLSTAGINAFRVTARSSKNNNKG